MLKTQTIIIAHRGYSARYLENSVEAISQALEVGVDMVEFDLHLTRDGALVVMHDSTTGRTAVESVRIGQVTLKRLREIPLKNGQAIPTLEEIIDLVKGRVPLNLELKGKGTGRALTSYLSENPYFGEVLVSSFREEELVNLSENLPDVPLARIYNRVKPEEIAQDAQTGYYSIHVHHKRVTRNLVSLAHTYGLRIFSFTVDTPSNLLHLMGMGVDGIFTNDPALALKVLKEPPTTSDESL